MTTKTHYVAIHAEDGVHRTAFSNLTDAVIYASEQLGRPHSGGSNYEIDEWGRAIGIHPMPTGVPDITTLSALFQAYDACERGTLTAEQSDLLAKHGW